MWDTGILSDLLKWAGVGLLDGGEGKCIAKAGYWCPGGIVC